MSNLVDQTKIKFQFKLDSKKEYLWTVPALPYKELFGDAKEFLNILYGWIFGPLISIGILLLISLWQPIVSLVIAILLFVTCIYLFVSQKSGSKKYEKKVSGDNATMNKLAVYEIWNSTFMSKAYFHGAFFISAGAVGYLLSCEILPFVHSFSGETTSKFQWFLYFVDSFLKVILFDSAEILGLKFSTIESNNSISKIAALILNLFITIGTFDAIILIYNTAFKTKEFIATPFEAVAKLYFLGKTKGVKIKVREIEDKENVIISEFEALDFVETFKDELKI